MRYWSSVISFTARLSIKDAERLRDDLLRLVPLNTATRDDERAKLFAELQATRAELASSRQVYWDNHLKQVESEQSERKPALPDNLVSLRQRLEEEKARQAKRAHADPTHSMANENCCGVPGGKDGW